MSATATAKQMEYIAVLVDAVASMRVMDSVITRDVEVENARMEIVRRLSLKEWTWIDDETTIDTWTLHSLEEWRHELTARVSEIQESVVDSATASAAITALKKILGRK